MNQTAQGPVAVPQGQLTETEQYLMQRIGMLENAVTGMAKHDFRSMSPGRVALVVGGTVVVMAGVGLASAAVYDRMKNGRTNQQKALK